MKSKTPVTNKLINHIFFVLDASSSIEHRHLKDAIRDITTKQIAMHAAESKRTGQEARISLYTFADSNNIQCHSFDVAPENVANLRVVYNPNGNTALIDGSLTALQDAKTISQLHGDHAFLFVVLTDGEENRSVNTSFALKQAIQALPENFTFSMLVPNQDCAFYAKNAGFPAGNVAIWETTVQGAYEAAARVFTATTSYYSGRSVGTRGTKTFFDMAAQNLDSRTVETKLEELSPSEYQLFPVFRKTPIKDFVERHTGNPYRIGSTYYTMYRAEKIQNYKQILVQNKSNGRIFAGENARKILELPSYEVTVNPASHPRYDLFLQSTSTNRNLIGGTQVIVLK